MAGVNRALAALKKKNFTGKSNDREKGVKIMGNDNKKKRESDHHDIYGKEKRRKIEECGSILPVVPMTQKRKIRENGERGCLPNQYSLQKEKESPSPSSDPSSCATTDEDCTTDVQLSTTKALRAARLKKRFAHLIFKANHQSAVMTQGNKGDPLRLQQERERLQREQIAEQARIEQQIRTSEAILRIRAEAELKMQRQREREAARIALEKMEKTVEFNDALQIMRDFESLLNCAC